MLVEKIGILDLLISISYAFIGLFITFILKRGSREPYQKFLIPFVVFKILCAYIFVLIHIYVYKGGDTFLYFAGSKFIYNAILTNPEHSLNYLFGSIDSFQNLVYTPEYFIVNSFRDYTTLFQARMTSFFTLLSFGKFLSTTVLISMFSAIGIWLIYKTLCKLYPVLYKHFAIGVLFFPTVGIWSSGILKDTFTMFAIGLILYYVYLIFTRGTYLKGFLFILLGTAICIGLKPYVLYILIPAMLIWYHANFISKIKSKVLRFITTPILLVLVIGAGYLVFQTISSQAGKYSIDNVESIAVGFYEWHTYLAETRNQSGYSLGEVDFSLLGLLSKAPQSAFVTLFRPLPFEVRNAAMALESLESTLLLIMTIYVLIKVGILTTLKIAIMNQNVRAFLLFALAFGVVVGFTSYNFGALSRYKIPCIPFYCASLSIIWYLGTGKLKATKTAY